MQRALQKFGSLAIALMVSTGLSFRAEAKSYSSGSHSYSSSSSHSSSGSSHSFSSGSHNFSSGSHSFSTSTHTSTSGGGSAHSSFSGGGGFKTFNSGGGKSYTSGSLWSDTSRHSYSSGKSYSSGSVHTFGSGFGTSPSSGTTSTTSSHSVGTANSASSQFTFDTAAAGAKKEEVSKQDFTRFNDSQPRPPVIVNNPPRPASDTYRVRPPPVTTSGYYRPRLYVPSPGLFSTRSVRVYNVFNPYYSRPFVVYHDPYSSFFWWWLLDRSLDDRAWWAYHHRYDMDPARYQALLATDQQLEARVDQLEAQQQMVRDPNYTPTGLDQDLMYSDQYVTRAYQNRPTTQGAVAFWVLAIPTALGVSGLFIWLIWFKRW